MELENVVVDLSKRLKKNTQSAVVSYDYFVQTKKIKGVEKSLGKLKNSQVALIKESSFKTDYIILLNLGKNCSLELIRIALKNCFKAIKKNNIESVAFLTDSFKKNINLGIFSKIAAQELFRHLRNKKQKTLKRVSFLTNASRKGTILKKNIVEYLNHIKINKGPFLTVDGIIQYKKGVVLIERTNPPLGWALPGGFVDYGEKLEEAVIREVKEETGLDFKNVRQFKAYSDNCRDPRFHTVSMVFTGKGKGKLKAASDAKAATVFEIKGKNPLANLPSNIAFDHKKIISEWLSTKL
ncbi:MAG: NUDIX hydrolase [Candidatus Omnitrophota bacterium]